jgi:hypothetical protein
MPEPPPAPELALGDTLHGAKFEEEPALARKPAASSKRPAVDVKLEIREPAPSAPKADEPSKSFKKVPSPAPADAKASSSSKLHSMELLESGISAQFFQNEQDSVPPFIDSAADDHDDLPHTPVLSPRAIARRARFRRMVAGVVTFAAVLSIGVMGKKLFTSKGSNAIAAPPPKAEMVVAPAAAPQPPKPAEPAKVAEAPKPEPAKTAEPVKLEDPKADAKGSDAKVADAKPEEEKPAEPKTPDPKVAAELKKKAESLLNRGNRKEAIVVSQQAIEADPSDAYPYLLLGSALQDSGKWKDGVEAYCECVRHATKGPINECRAMGGHK